MLSEDGYFPQCQIDYGRTLVKEGNNDLVGGVNHRTYKISSNILTYADHHGRTKGIHPFISLIQPIVCEAAVTIIATLFFQTASS